VEAAEHRALKIRLMPEQGRTKKKRLSKDESAPRECTTRGMMEIVALAEGVSAGETKQAKEKCVRVRRESAERRAKRGLQLTG